MQDLNNLVKNLPAGVTLREAHAINKAGQIAGVAEVVQGANTFYRAFLLTPAATAWIPSVLQLLLFP
jgi:hypothetical protein